MPWRDVRARVPRHPGRDFAGVVEQVGDGVSRYRVGDEVFGFVSHANPTVHAGSWAELIVLPEDDFVAAKPEGVDTTTAGTVPSPRSRRSPPSTRSRRPRARSARRRRNRRCRQLLRAAGRLGGRERDRPALPEDEAYLRDLGVSEILDRNADLAAAVQEAHPDGVDVLFDVVRRRPILASERGRPAGLSARSRRRGRGTVQRVAVSSPANLQRLGELLAAGRLRVPIQRSYPLEQVGEALQALPTSHTQGKLGITIT